MLKGVIFDFDDTLVNSLETYWRLFNRGVTGSGQAPIGKEALAAAISQGKKLKEIVSEAYPHLSEAEVGVCLGEMRRSFDAVITEYPIALKPQAREVLGALKARGLRIGLVTARVEPVAEMWAELERLGISRFFESVVTGQEIPRKPAPDGILHCLDELGLKARESVFIGDSEVDIRAGRDAGVGVILLGNGLFDRKALDPALTLAVVDDLRQVLDYLTPPDPGSLSQPPAA